MKFVRVGSPALQRMFANSSFLRRIARPVRFNYAYDVPYLSGYSKDGRTIYVDRGLKRYWRYQGRLIDVVDFLVVHEVVEKAILDIWRFKYQKAHHLAQHAESLACRQHGINWWAYTRFLKPQIKAAYNKPKFRLPPDFDLQPYIDENDIKVLKFVKGKRRKYVKEQLTISTQSNNIVRYIRQANWEKDGLY